MKRRRVEKCTSKTKQIEIRNFKPNLICREYIVDRVVQSFIANSQHAMDFHLNEVHGALVCSFCFVGDFFKQSRDRKNTKRTSS